MNTMKKGADGLTHYERAIRMLNIVFQDMHPITEEKIRAGVEMVVNGLLPQHKMDIDIGKLTEEMLERWNEFIASYVVKDGYTYFVEFRPNPSTSLPTSSYWSKNRKEAKRFRIKADAEKVKDETGMGRVVLLVKKEDDDG